MFAPSQSTSILAKYTKPLTSSNCQSLQICAEKLAPQFEAMHIAPQKLFDMVDFLSNHESQMKTRARRRNSSGVTFSSQEADIVSLIDEVVPALWRLIEEGHPLVAYCLLILRMVALQHSNREVVQACLSSLMRALDDQSKVGIGGFFPHLSVPSAASQESTSASSNHNTALLTLDSLPQSETDFHDSCREDELIHDPSLLLLFPTSTLRSLAWCVVSNYAASHYYYNGRQRNLQQASSSMIPTHIIDAALRDWTHEDSTQIRQAASSFLYNYVISYSRQLENDEETTVSILCSSLECLTDETDPTTRLRKLLVTGRVIFGVHHMHISRRRQRRRSNQQEAPSPLKDSPAASRGSSPARSMGELSTPPIVVATMTGIASTAIPVFPPLLSSPIERFPPPETTMTTGTATTTFRRSDSSSSYASSGSEDSATGVGGHNEVAKDLVEDLGFVGMLHEVLGVLLPPNANLNGGSSPPDHTTDIQCEQLVQELLVAFRT